MILRCDHSLIQCGQGTILFSREIGLFYIKGMCEKEHVFGYSVYSYNVQMPLQQIFVVGRYQNAQHDD